MSPALPDLGGQDRPPAQAPPAAGQGTSRPHAHHPAAPPPPAAPGTHPQPGPGPHPGRRLPDPAVRPAPRPHRPAHHRRHHPRRRRPDPAAARRPPPPPPPAIRPPSAPAGPPPAEQEHRHPPPPPLAVPRPPPPPPAPPPHPAPPATPQGVTTHSDRQPSTRRGIRDLRTREHASSCLRLRLATVFSASPRLVRRLTWRGSTALMMPIPVVGVTSLTKDRSTTHR